MDALDASITAHLPEGPMYYPEDVTVDRNEDFVFSEFIREQIHRMTHAEVPFSTAVEINSLKQDEESVHIDAFIYVERDSQKGILVGAGGKSIRQIKKKARERIKRFTGKDVHMSIRVKVSEKWTRNPGRMSYLGYR
jgi:GTP-binding protein Era